MNLRTISFDLIRYRGLTSGAFLEDRPRVLREAFSVHRTVSRRRGGNRELPPRHKIGPVRTMREKIRPCVAIERRVRDICLGWPSDPKGNDERACWRSRVTSGSPSGRRRSSQGARGILIEDRPLFGRWRHDALRRHRRGHRLSWLATPARRSTGWQWRSRDRQRRSGRSRDGCGDWRWSEPAAGWAGRRGDEWEARRAAIHLLPAPHAARGRSTAVGNLWNTLRASRRGPRPMRSVPPGPHPHRTGRAAALALVFFARTTSS